MTTLHSVRSQAVRRIRPLFQSCSAPTRRGLSIGQTHDPLRILFCGSDEFSVYSLRALDSLRLEQPEKVASIDVVCRTDKRVGRGLKNIHSVPIKKIAGDKLGLNVHQIDTFTGWTPPCPAGQPINLVVAVSFGRLVPPRILGATKYGGLNVHPSMLPDLHGPAPLHHTLLNRMERTGVTLQTLHASRFDEGLIVDQTPRPGVPVPDPGTATPDSLVAFLGPLGADMLRTNIQNGTFATTTAAAAAARPRLADGHLARHAPKITPADRRIDWDGWTADEIVLRERVLGRLWDERRLEPSVTHDAERNADPAPSTRTIYHGFTKSNGTYDKTLSGGGAIGATGNGAVSLWRDGASGRVAALLKCCDGSFVVPSHVKPAGGNFMPADRYYSSKHAIGSWMPK
ncbi:hypothetical protein MBLNU459_g2530t1 [Dothideomycetes sp. NU459]